MDALAFHLMVNHVPVIALILGSVLVLLALVIRRRSLWKLGTASIAVAGYAFWRAARGPSSEPPVVPAWLRGAVVVTALAATAASVRTAYLAGFIAHKNPLLMRATVPPADSIPEKPVHSGPPPE